MVAFKVAFNQRLIVACDQLKSGEPWNIIRRHKASAATSETPMKSTFPDQRIQSSAVEDDEWNSAKPFEEIPGIRKLPVVGTVWGFLPVVGTLTLLTVYPNLKG